MRRLDPETGNPLPGGSIAIPSGARGLVFSADGRRFIVCLANGTVEVRASETGRLVGPPLVSGQPDQQNSGLQTAIALDTTGRLALTSWGRMNQVWEVETGLPLGPPLRFKHLVDRVLLRDDASVVAFSIYDTIETWDFAKESRPLEQLTRVAQLLSSRRITPEGTEVRLTEEALRRDWSELHGRVPELPGEPVERATDWHRRLAAEAEADGDWFATVVHLDPLVSADPDNPDLRRRRAEPEAELGRLKAANADFTFVAGHVQADFSAKLSMAVLCARLGDRDGFRSALKPMLASAARDSYVTTSGPILHAATLLPGVQDDPAALVTLAERALKMSPTDSSALSALAFAEYRAGRFEDARKSVAESLATYATKGSGVRAEKPVAAFVPSPAATPGTPREWLLLALVEARLGHRDDAAAWLEKSARWLDRAIADPTDPSLLGAMNTPSDRSISAMLAGGPTFMARSLPRQGVNRYLPTWRELLELRILRDEAEALLRPGK